MENKIDFVEQMRTVKAYLNSKENREVCEPFILDCQRLAENAYQYKDRIKSIYEKLNGEVIRREYAVGGENLHRGFYCPSPVFDVVVGKAARGKLLKRLTIRSHPTYTYCFNKDNRLIITDHHGSSEVVLHNDGVETGIGFSNEYEITTLAECTYDGNQIKSFVHCLYNSYNKKCDYYYLETYEYSEGKLMSSDLFQFSNSCTAPILQHSKYLFQHDEEGYLLHYTVVEYDERNRVKEDSCWKDHVFDVYLKRKV